MVSGKPPRRTRQKDEPLTIDLEAEKTAAEADSSAEVTPAASGAQTDTATSAPVTEGLADAPGTGIDPAASAEQTVAADQLESPAPHEPETAAAAGEQAAEPQSQMTGDSRDPEPTPRPATEDRKPAGFGTGALVAAIIGGLVALAGAGALQYGGVLPALGPSGGTATPAPSGADLAALSARLDRLQGQFAAAPANGAGSNAALVERLNAVEAAVKSGAGQGGVQSAANTEALAALKAEQGQATNAIAALRTELATLKQAVADARKAGEARTAELERKVDAPRRDISMAKAIAVSSLKTAIDRGGPFLGELDTLTGISADDPVIGVLKPFAAIGVPARAELIRRFPVIADQIISTVNQPAESANWGDRLMASAMSIVKVRPVGNVEGDTPEAIVARMEEKLRDGDLKGAAIEWQSLPGPAKQVSAEFARNLENRVTIETAVNAALAGAVGDKG